MTEATITPSPELVLHWYLNAKALPVDQWVTDVATCAAQWGADQELEACCLWLNGGSKIDYDTAALLRAARRPKSQTLKSDALFWLEKIERDRHYLPKVTDAIRDALERLDDA